MNTIFKILVALVFAIGVTFSVGAQTKLGKSKYGNIISTYLNSTTIQSKASKADLKELYVNRENFSEKTGIANVYLNQTYKGVKVFNAISSVGIKNNEVFHYADNFKNNIAERIASSTAVIDEAQAIQKVAAFFKLGKSGTVAFLEHKNGKKLFSKGLISQEPIPVEMVYAENKEGELVLSYNLSIYTLDSAHWWSARVDAKTGEIIDYNDWVTHCTFGDSANHFNKHSKKAKKDNALQLFKTRSSFTPEDGSQYNVYSLPTESPSHGSRNIVTEPANGTASPFGWHDTDGIAGAEFTITRGNNVWALDDLDANSDTNGFSAEGDASLNFNFSLDFDQEPDNYLDASTTQLFYLNNMMHDILYQHGFDEVSGNYQENNYGKGGLEGDYVVAETQDGASLNNARFSTPPDGERAKMEMYLFDATGDAGNSLTINGGPLAGDYIGFVAEFGDFTTQPLTSDLVLVVDDDSQTPNVFRDPNDGCDVIVNAAELEGKIAVVKRRLCFEDQKVLAAQNAGAIGVIVVTTEDEDPELMTTTVFGIDVTIPSIMIEHAIGTSIIDALSNGETINATMIDAGPYPVDGAFDNGIAAHEYAHGLSFRLTGGADTVGCLRSKLQMGEGWSDWFGLMISMKASDISTEGRGIGTYSLGEPNDGLGLRTQLYSTDFAVNNFTYGSTNDPEVVTGVNPSNGVPSIAVHYVGSIWCTMLWDLTWAYIDKYGFDPDLVNGTGGNNRVMRLVIEGLKLQPCDPEFIEGRDAILAADVALTGGENQCLIWDVFANRGLGVNASGGSEDDVDDQVESFDTPPDSDPSLANCSEATLGVTDFTSKSYSIFPNPTSSTITIKTKQTITNATIRIIDIKGRNVLKSNVKQLDEIALDVNTLHSGMYFLNIKGDTVEINEKIIIN